jgi:hypothetical protein
MNYKEKNVEKIVEDLEAGSQEQERRCFICWSYENEVENIIGIFFDELDHKDRKDIFLCDGCISEASAILEEVKFRKRVSDEIQRLQAESTNENTM